MSGQAPKVLSASTGAGAALLPFTSGSRFVFWVAVAALAIGLVTLAISGLSVLRQRLNRN